MRGGETWNFCMAFWHSLLGPITDEAGFAEVKNKTEAKRAKDVAATASKEAAETNKRQKLIDATPIAAAAMKELESTHGGNWMKLSKEQLLALCCSRGLSTSGNKPDLVARLSAAPQMLALMPPPTTTVEEERLLGHEQELEGEAEESEAEAEA